MYSNLTKAQQLIEVGKILPVEKHYYSASLASELIVDALIGMTVMSTSDFFTGDITADRVDMIDYSIAALADAITACVQVASGQAELNQIEKHLKTATTFWLNSKATDRQEILA